MRAFLIRSGNFGLSDGQKEISATASFLKKFGLEKYKIDFSKLPLYSSESERVRPSSNLLYRELGMKEIIYLEWLTEPAHERTAIELESFMDENRDLVSNVIIMTHLTEICRCQDHFSNYLSIRSRQGLSPGGVCLIDDVIGDISEIFPGS